MYLIIAAMMAIPSLMSAQPHELSEAPDFEIGCRSVYWGTEASTHPNNPCKGATTRKCAEIESEIIRTSDGISMVVTTVKDRYGIVKSVSQNFVAAPASDIIQDAIVKLPANAEMIHIRQ